MSQGKKEEGEGEEAAATTTDMTEYCKKLESWLWKAYTQRALATSAYFTALNYGTPNMNPLFGMNYYFGTNQQQQQAAPGGGGVPGQGLQGGGLQPDGLIGGNFGGADGLRRNNGMDRIAICCIELYS